MADYCTIMRLGRQSDKMVQKRLLKISQQFDRPICSIHQTIWDMFREIGICRHGGYRLIIMLEKCGRPDLNVFHLK